LAEVRYYHGLLGYLYTDVNILKDIEHYKQAIKVTGPKTKNKH